MALSVVSSRRAIVALAALGLAVSSAALAVTAHPVAASAAPQFGDYAAFATTSSTISLHGRGNGHGHGMSQYGAQGAALAGLSSKQIVAFYYPGTSLTTLAPSTIRVSISGAGPYTTVSGSTPGLTVTGHGALSTSKYQRYRLIPLGSGLGLGGQDGSGNWHRVASDLPARADFSSSKGYVRLYFPDGTSTRYRGTVGAVRNGSGLLTINRTSLDNYTMGVVPREMPASWRPAAVGAQAIAARTYGRNAVESHGGSLFDICDTTSCQVYGGMTHYSSGGSVLWNDDPAAIVGNENQVLRYSGHTIFAQFSASNGGAMLSGGLPYLVNKADPYDNSSSGDPYLDWSDSVSASNVASYYGLKAVSSIEVTKRNGYGTWGGWVLSATVDGTSWSGATKHVSTTGSTLAYAMGVRTAYFHFDDEPVPPGAPQSVHAKSAESGAMVYWSPPSGAVSSYRLSWGHHRLVLPASKHQVFLSPIWQNQPENVWIAATNAYGTGPSARVTVQGTPKPDSLVAISPDRLFDTRTSGGPVTLDHPYEIDVAGKGNIAARATSVQLSLTIANETDPGHLDVYVHGSPGAPAVSVPYHRDELLTTTVSIALRPTSTLVFKPSAGSVNIYADQQSYTAHWGHFVRAVSPSWQTTIDEVGTDGSSTVDFDGAPVVNSDTRMVLIGVRAWSGTSSAYLRIWPDDRSQPKVLDVVTAPSGPDANTLFIRLPASHRIHLVASKPGVGARVTLLGTVGNGGGQLEVIPAQPIADDLMPSRPSLSVGTDTTYEPVLGVGPTPATGVKAVLVQLRVLATRNGGKLWAWPTGSARPEGAVIRVHAGELQVATALVKVGTAGRIDLRGSTGGLKVSLWSMGYLTAP